MTTYDDEEERAMVKSQSQMRVKSRHGAIDSQGEDHGGKSPPGLHVQPNSPPLQGSSVEDFSDHEESETYMNQVSGGSPPNPSYLDRNRVISDNLPISTLGRSQSRDDFLHHLPSRSSSKQGSKTEIIIPPLPIKISQPQPQSQPQSIQRSSQPQPPLPLTNFSSLEQSYSDSSSLKKKNNNSSKKTF